MDFPDELVDQLPEEERRRQRKMARATNLPCEDVMSVRDGAPGYRGIATAIEVAGEDVIIMARNSDVLMKAHQKITNFADFRLGLVHKCVVMAAVDVKVDDEL